MSGAVSYTALDSHSRVRRLHSSDRGCRSVEFGEHGHACLFS